MPEHAYFSAETSLSTRAFYAVLCLITLVYSLIGLFSPLLAPKCDIPLLDKAVASGFQCGEITGVAQNDPSAWFLSYGNLDG